jgi:uncharacterized membrane protein
LAESILVFLEGLLGSEYLGRCAAIFLISLLPGVGGPSTTIPLGVALGLPTLVSAVICVIGNILPVPFIIIFIRRIFAIMRKISKPLGRIADKFEEKAKAKGARLRRGVFIGLMIFVAIPLPLPGMGAWTGALIAAIFDVRLKIALPAISIGVLIAAMIATGVTYGFITVLS